MPLQRSFLSLFLTLIPKVYSSSSLRDFLPIFLVRSLYNLLEKYLAGRLAKTMDKLISFK